MRFDNYGLGVFAVALAAFGLASCGGGGGGGPQTGITTPTPPSTPTTPTTPAFVSWSNDLKPGSTVTVPGRSQSFGVTGVTSGVTAVGAPSVIITTNFVEKISAAGVVSSIEFGAPNRTLPFDTAAGDTIATIGDPRILGAVSKDQSRVALAANPTAIGWDYQSFGVWQSTDSATTGSAGMVSVGAVTSHAGIPTTGTAVFRGLAGGIYIDPAGGDHPVAAELTMNADFAARRVLFSTPDMTGLFEATTFSGTAINGSLSWGGVEGPRTPSPEPWPPAASAAGATARSSAPPPRKSAACSTSHRSPARASNGFPAATAPNADSARASGG